MNKPTQIKVPEGVVKRARENGIFNESLIYYMLKLHNTEGSISKNDVLKVIKSISNLSDSSAWRKLKVMVNAGLIVRNKDSYNLVSYDKFFKILGYGMKKRWRKDRSFLRKGNFRIVNVGVYNAENIQQLEDTIISNEIWLNHFRQLCKIRRIKDSELIQSSFKLIKDVSDCVKVFQPINEGIDVPLIKKLQSTLTGLSCKGFSNLLGYKSSKSGYDKICDMVSRDVLEVEKREIFMFRDINDYFFNLKRAEVKLQTSHIRSTEKGELFIKLKNGLKPTVIEPCFQLTLKK